jgi:hypothetical protein
MTLNEVAVNTPFPAYQQENLAELGATLAAAGWSILEARALIAQVQAAASQVALEMAPQILEQVRRVNQARQTQMYTQIRMLPNMAGYVSRDRVLQIVQDTYSTPPRN